MRLTLKLLVFSLFLYGCSDQNKSSKESGRTQDSKKTVIILKPIVNCSEDSVILAQLDSLPQFIGERAEQSIPKEARKDETLNQHTARVQFWQYMNQIGFNIESAVSLYFTEILYYVTIDRDGETVIFPVVEESTTDLAATLKIARKYKADFVVNFPNISIIMQDTLITSSAHFQFIETRTRKILRDQKLGMLENNGNGHGYFSCYENHVLCAFSQPLEQALYSCIYPLTGDPDAR